LEKESSGKLTRSRRVSLVQVTGDCTCKRNVVHGEDSVVHFSPLSQDLNGIDGGSMHESSRDPASTALRARPRLMRISSENNEAQPFLEVEKLRLVAIVRA
jgi:hypothetical protein